jgi:peptidyl-prolyl cis-trans isomerase A (cyclophilin A)
MKAIFLAALCSVLAAGQTATKSGAAKGGAASSNPKLLTPAALKAPAPLEYKVKFTTTKGDLIIDVHRDWSPNGADRFYNLVRANYFDNVRFFRAVKGFMVQFGISPRVDVNRAWLNANIKDDKANPNVHNKRGFVSFASAGPNTRTTQVFINLVDNSRLDPMGFTPFGEVVEGMETVDTLYMDYGEATTNDQENILNGGEAYMAKKWPKTDKIMTARIEGAPAAAPAAKKAPPAKKSAAPKQ